MPVLPSYKNQSIDLPANQLTGFYTRATQAFNGLMKKTSKYCSVFKKEMKYGMFTVSRMSGLSMISSEQPDEPR